MKTLLSKLLQLLGWITHCELQCSDVVGWKVRCNRPMRLIAAEAERSLRNAVPNALRNFGGGCDAMIALVTTNRRRAALRKHYQGHLPRTMWTRIAILAQPQVEQLIVRIQRASLTSGATGSSCPDREERNHLPEPVPAGSRLGQSNNYRQRRKNYAPND